VRHVRRREKAGRSRVPQGVREMSVVSSKIIALEASIKSLLMLNPFYHGSDYFTTGLLLFFALFFAPKVTVQRFNRNYSNPAIFSLRPAGFGMGENCVGFE
jgi:hypothetical protein